MVVLDKFICYYINLNCDMSRNDHCIKLLYDMNFDEINRIEPTDKRSFEIWKTEKKCSKCKHTKSYGKPRGFKSLTFTTKKIFDEILKRDDDTYYFIFEDDIELAPEIKRSEFKNIIRKEVSVIKKYEDFIYLGLIIPNTEIQNKDTPFNPMRANGYATHAYMINKSGVKELIRQIPCWHHPIDGMYRHFVTAPLVGFNYCSQYGPGHRGYFFQDREAVWYEGARIVTQQDISENLEYEEHI